jgi:hypothetical protein
MSVVEERPDSLEVLLAREWPKEPEEVAALPLEDQEALKFLLKMRELARGLVDSEYWELINVVLVSDMETAKGALEDPSTSDKDLRVAQGAARALRLARNFFLTLAKVEEPNGEE